MNVNKYHNILVGREEGAALLALVDKYGDQNWAGIAKQLPGRSKEQCRHHWETVVNPYVNDITKVSFLLLLCSVTNKLTSNT